MSEGTPVPEGHHSIVACITIKNAARAIDFYREAFGARELCRFADNDGKIGHAELQIGDSRLMLHDEYPQWAMLGPRTLGGTPFWLLVYVDDADAAFGRALAAGARELVPMADGFYGDRCGRLQDPFGHRWIVATHKHDVGRDEMDQGARELHGLSLTVYNDT
jgi:PhnB protein